jgi:hypothetical protein
MQNPSKEPWCLADLFFLRDTLRRGMKPNEVAAFLGRAASEVMAKAKELGIPVTEGEGRGAIVSPVRDPKVT